MTRKSTTTEKPRTRSRGARPANGKVVPMKRRGTVAASTELEALNPSEAQLLAELEEVIERGLAEFHRVGDALLRVNQQRLYRSIHRTFDAYCRERWGISRQRGRQLMEAVEMTTIVVTAGLPAPTNEAQTRELVPLRKDEAVMVEVWRKAHESAEQQGKSRPTAQMVKEARCAVLEPLMSAGQLEGTGFDADDVDNMLYEIGGLPELDSQSDAEPAETPEETAARYPTAGAMRPMREVRLLYPLDTHAELHANINTLRGAWDMRFVRDVFAEAISRAVAGLDGASD